jgi:WD40 repeat protein
LSILHAISGCDNTERRADVVFVHGLGGDAFDSWRHGKDESTSWPRWLGREFPQAGVWSIGYAASPTKWTRFLGWCSEHRRDAGQGMALPDRALQVLDSMVQRGLGERPIFFICHSLGGLLVKQILRKSADDSDGRLGKVFAQTRAVLFLATPHAGAALASLAGAFRTVFHATVTVQDLEAHDAHLRDLFDWYRNHAGRAGIRTTSYFELRKTKGITIVNPTSAHPGIGADPVGLDEDHISIAKPRSKDSQVYRAANQMLRDNVLALEAEKPGGAAIQDHGLASDLLQALHGQPEAASERSKPISSASTMEAGAAVRRSMVNGLTVRGQNDDTEMSPGSIGTQETRKDIHVGLQLFSGRRVGMLLAGGLALGLAIVGVTYVRNKPLRDSRRLATEALAHDELDLAALLSIHAFQTAPTFEARRSLLEIGQRDPKMITSLPHSSGLRSAVFSPDRSTLASATEDGGVYVWNVTRYPVTPELLRGHEGTVYGVAFRPPNGEILASGGADRTVRLWNVKTGEQIGPPLLGHNARVSSVVFTPDGKRLVSADLDGVVLLWDVNTRSRLGEPVQVITGAILSASLGRDGQTLALAGDNGSLLFWDLATKKVVRRLPGHNGQVTSLAFSRDGTKLASAGADKTVRLWAVDSGQPIGEPLEGHTGSVRGVAFSPDGNTLASVAEDRAVILWDVREGKRLGQPLRGHSGAILSVMFNWDGKTIASASADKTVRLWSTGEDRSGGGLVDGHEGFVESVAFSSDGEKLASASDDKTVRLWDVTTRQPLGKPLRGHTDIVYSVALSTDKTTLASGSKDGTVRLWDVASGDPIGEPLAGHTNAVYAVAFSPDGKRLASASQDRTVRLWDVAKRAPLGAPLEGHGKAVYALAFSPNGETLASASADHSIILWDVATGKAAGTLEGHSGRVGGVAFSPDGRWLASAGADKNVVLWEVQSRKMSGKPLQGHTNTVNSVAFNSDGNILASAGIDQRVRLWDVASGQFLGELTGHQGAVLGLAFSAQGKLASASADKTIRLWDVDPASWIDRACKRANRNLSMAEFQNYVGRHVAYTKACSELPPGEGAPAN